MSTTDGMTTDQDIAAFTLAIVFARVNECPSLSGTDFYTVFEVSNAIN